MTRTVEDLYFPTANDGETHRKRTLLIPTHTAAASARVSIAHAQLRHLVSCPQQRGIVYYVSDKSIVECDLLHQHPPRCIIDLEFAPTCLAVTAIGANPTTILFAAGGYTSDLHISFHSFPLSTHNPSHGRTPSPSSPKLIWRHATRLRGKSEIVNSILFSPASLTDDTRRSTSDIRIAVSGNNSAVKIFEVGMQPNLQEEKRLQECGSVGLETPVNHMSISPDGRTLLCVGDTPKAYLFNISPGPTTTFSPLATYTLPSPPATSALANIPPSPTTPPPNFRSLACFCTAWSADGLKFAVASQEGQLCVWDVRSARPLFTYWTSYRRNSTTGRNRLGEWEWEDLGGHMRFHDDGTNNGPDSGIRNIRFSEGEGGRELMVFTEHTTNLHVIDARTFDPVSHNILPFPDLSSLLQPSPQQPLPTPEARSPSPPNAIRTESPPLNATRGRDRSTSRSRSRSRSPTIVQAPRFGSRSRSPPRSPIMMTSHMAPLSTISPLPMSSVPDEQGLFWPPSGMEQLPPESRARLDADGDVIEAVEGENRGHVLVVDPSDETRDDARWPRRGHRFMMRQRAMSTRSPVVERERDNGAAPLESVAEGGEPAPLPRPAHLAGLCFDPSGGWVYVAAEGGIVEWRVREREEGKTFWGSGAWA